MPGLSAPVEIRVDRWGVPHIEAAEHYDAFVAQGWNAARDRLWQIDLWRRRGLGRLSEVLGERFVPQDRAARLFLYRGDLYPEWLAYGSDAKRIAEAFVTGVNAYVEMTRRDPSLLPPEFGLLGYRPEPWQAADVVRIRSHGLWRNVVREVRRARVYCQAGPEVDAQRHVLEPAWTPQVPEGLDPCQVPEDVLRDYLVAKAPVSFAEPEAAAERAARAELHDDVGSNNWAVAPSRTASGRPILANDPHRGHAVPSLRYVAHLRAPGLDVIGAGEPGLPGISIGHNQRIAFGLTIFAIDQEDLYVYELSPDDPERYRYGDGWERFEKIRERLPVAGGAERTIEMRFSRHGPIVAHDPAGGRAFAVRAAWLEPGMAPYFGSVEYMRAQSWREFLAALNRWGAPAENQVYADIDGNIGYKPAGLFPRRRNFDGLLPVPGDGRYEWDGFFDMDALPVEFNPERGFVATANAMNLPPGYPISERRVGFEWSQPWRHRRVFEVLAAQPRHDFEQSLALQRDYHSVLAREIVAALDAHAPVLAEHAPFRLLRSLEAGNLPADSNAAALYAVWFFRHLTPAVGRRVAPGVAPDLIDPIDPRTVLARVAQRTPEASALVRETLDAAWAELSQRLGPDPARWRWGALHEIAPAHPLHDHAPDALRAQMQLPAFPRGGSANSPNNGWFPRDSYRVRGGASWRMVLDVGRWDDARMTSTPGQSGDPRSPLYGNLLEGWASDDSFPLLYSDAAIEAHTILRFRLVPR